MDREAIRAAVFDLLRYSMDFKTASRKLKHWSDVPAEDRPALFVTQGQEENSGGNGKPTLWKLHGDIYIYVQTDAQIDDSVTPSQVLNPLLDAVEALLSPNDIGQHKQTLGGLVERCYISGPIETSEGNLGDQEIAVIPFTIVVP